MKEKIYLDNNATTKIDPEVVHAMFEELHSEPSNPSSIHSFGRAARGRLINAREQIASYFSVSPSELIFTSSGTEALNMAIFGLKSTGHIISSSIEHKAVLNPLKSLETEISYLDPGPFGTITPAQVKNAIRPNTSLIVLSAANSETGVKTPIEEIAQIASAHNIPFIVDGVALLGKEPIILPQGVTAMTFSAHKCHGPKGIGLLILRKRNKIKPLLLGGAQESNRRAGTENLPGIIGFAKALELACKNDPTSIEKLRDSFENLLKKEIPDLQINGTGPRICNTSNLQFPGVDGEALLIHLDNQGIAASMGSACSSGALEPSHVLLGMGLSSKEALSSIRFSLSRFTHKQEIEMTSKCISEAIKSQLSRK